MAETPTPAPAPAPAAKKSNTLLIIIIVVAVLALGGGGAGAYFLLRHRGGEATVEAKAVEVPEGIISFEPFVVNLADPGGAHFLRVTIRLLVDEKEAEKIQKNEVTVTRLRSAMLEVLSEQSGESLVTVPGKEALKKVLAERATTVMQHTKVADVLFSDFVVQF
jgi:flagellar FliL protein